jgi:RHS repeat-associated protein
LNFAMSMLIRSWLLLIFVGVGSVAQAQVPSNPYSYSRTSQFSYYQTTDGLKAGLLKTETVESANVQSCVNITYDYDAYGNKTTATTANCTGATGRAVIATRTSTTAYLTQTVTVAGTSVTSPAGIFATGSTNALSQSESKTYDPRFGAMLALTGPNSLTTTLSVDDFGRTVKELRADGTSTVSAYCILSGKLPTTTSNSSTTNGDPMSCPTPAAGEAPADAVSFVHREPHGTTGTKIGSFVRVYKDRQGRELRTVTESFDGASQPAGRSGVTVAKDTVYSAYGAKIYETQPYFLTSSSSTTAGSNDVGVTKTDYDVLGRVTTVNVADANGSQSGVSFGSYGTRQAAKQTIAYSGLTVTATNDKGQTRKEEKNAIGELVRVTDATGAQLAHQRDAFGNLVATKDALQNSITFKYDIRGRKTQMKDPDAGTWLYDYDVLGELVWQQSPNQLAVLAQTTMAYDVLGRQLSRAEAEYTTTWTYDKYADASACTKGVGKLCEVTTSIGVNRKLVYDGFGRPINTRTNVTIGSSQSFASAIAYESTTGRIISQTYPTGVQVGYAYTTRGFLEKLVLNTAATVNPLPPTVGGTAGPTANLPIGTVLWQAKIVNAWSRAEQQSLSNGITSQAAYESASGRVTDVTAGASGSTTVLNQHYTWDSLNNMTGRVDNNGDRDINTGTSTGAVSETFGYDPNLNRLTNYTVSASAISGLIRTVSLQYNAAGMLLYKTDVGNYSYPTQGATSVRPHALQSVAASSTTTFGYDANGNLTSATAGKYRTVGYTSFNLPDSSNGIQGASGSPKYTWFYDENHARIKEVRVDSSGTRTVWYLHPDNQGGLGFETETAAGSGAISNRHFLSAGGAAIGVLVSTGALPTLTSTQTAPNVLSSVTLVKVEFWHKDHLGSLIATTDHTGAVTQRYSWDPFGKRRYTNGSYDEFGNLVIDWSSSVNWGTDRGFTGHEQLDDIGLVNMNGRIYDATLGLFLQADPFIQDPSNLQNYNRYGYCFSNPLTCTDPSGQSFLDYLTGVAGLKLFRWVDPLTWRLARTPFGYQVGSIAIAAASAIYCGEAAAACNAIGQATLSAIAGYSAEQSLRAGAFAFISTEVNMGIGNAFGNGTFSNTLAHGVWGCMEGEMQGGGCGSGFRAGFVGAAISNTVGSIGNPRQNIGDLVINTVIHSVAGCAASVSGGGKCAQGAESAAFAYLFNELAHESSCVQRGYCSKVYSDGTVCQAGKACYNPLETPGPAQQLTVAQAVDILLVGSMFTGVGELGLLARSLASEAQVAELLATGGTAISGAGTSTVLRDAPRLAATYGGAASDWAKVSASVYKGVDGFIVETHAYVNTVTKQLVEMKSKVGF